RRATTSCRRIIRRCPEAGVRWITSEDYNASKFTADISYESSSLSHRRRRAHRGECFRSDLPAVPKLGRERRQLSDDEAREDGLGVAADGRRGRSEEHTSELQSHLNLVRRLLLEKKNRVIASPAVA